MSGTTPIKLLYHDSVEMPEMKVVVGIMIEKQKQNEKLDDESCVVDYSISWYNDLSIS